MNTGLLNTTAIRNVLTKTQQTDGSWKVTATATTSGIPCAIQTSTSTEAEEFYRNTGRRVVVGYFPYTYAGTTLSFAANETITVGSVTYQVRGEAFDMAGRGEFWKVFLEVVK